MVSKRSGITVSVLLLIIPLASCSGGGLGDSIRRSLAADPRLENNPTLLEGNAANSVSGQCSDAARAELPRDFPSDLCYPRAELVRVDEPSAVTASSSEAGQAPTVETSWTTTDTPEQVQQFYIQLFEQQTWEITQRPEPGSSNPSDALEAVKDGVRLRLLLNSPEASGTASDTAASDSAARDEAAPPAATLTAFTLAFSTRSGAIASSREPSSNAAASPPEAESSASPRLNSSTFSDLDDVPEELRTYVQEVADLGVLTPAPAASAGTTDPATFGPNQIITRREFAQWLFNTNNAIYTDQPAKRIRAATGDAQPAFQDVPRSDRDFDVIQGLAEAGLIPSSLSGDPTLVNFRPDAQLTREDLITWKVPLDVRRNLPTATVDAVQQTWGFQDAARINPRALKAVLADYQNGDLANIRRAFGYTTLLQPQKAVTRAEAAAVLWYFGYQGDGLSVKDAAQSDRPGDSGSDATAPSS